MKEQLVSHCFLVALFFLDPLVAQWHPLHQFDPWKQRSEREKRCVAKSKNKRREKGRGGGKRRREEEGRGGGKRRRKEEEGRGGGKRRRVW